MPLCQLYLIENVMVNQEDDGWDGTFRGRPMPMGVYLWKARVVFPDGRGDSYSGSVQLMR